MRAARSSAEIAKMSPSSFEIVEISGSGHRLWYVSLLLERAIEQGLSFRLTISPQAAISSGWTEFVAPLLERFPFDVNVSAKTRREILSIAARKGTRIVVPDGDRWIGALLASVFRGRKLAANVLIMRPFAEQSRKSQVKHWLKQALWSVATYCHPQVSVYRLVPLPGVGLLREIPDPVALHNPLVRRDDWFRSQALDPNMKWLVVLGELSRRKHLPEIFAAFASDELSCSAWGLVAVGTMSAEVEADLRRTASMHASRIVLRHGFVSGEDFDAWICHADAVAVLHRNEGSSGVLLKCWAAGTAVLAGGAQSVIKAARDLRLPGERISSVTAESIVEAVFRLEDRATTHSSAPTNDALVERNRRFVDSLLCADDAAGH